MFSPNPIGLSPGHATLLHRFDPAFSLSTLEAFFNSFKSEDYSIKRLFHIFAINTHANRKKMKSEVELRLKL